MWPEVIPPSGGLIFLLFGLLAMGLSVLAYWLCRKGCSRADFALVGLVPFALLALAFAITDPRTAIVTLWPALVGSLVWVLVLMYMKPGSSAGDLPAWISAAALLVFIPFVLIGTFQGSGLNDAALMAAIWALLTLAVLPALEAAFSHLLAAK